MLCKVFAFLFFLVASGCAASADQQERENAVIYRVTSPVLVHEQPSDNATVTGELIAGHAITVLSSSEDWLYVTAQAGAEQVTGYIVRDRTNFEGVDQ